MIGQGVPGECEGEVRGRGGEVDGVEFVAELRGEGGEGAGLGDGGGGCRGGGR